MFGGGFANGGIDHDLVTGKKCEEPVEGLGCSGNGPAFVLSIPGASGEGFDADEAFFGVGKFDQNPAGRTRADMDGQGWGHQIRHGLCRLSNLGSTDSFVRDLYGFKAKSQSLFLGRDSRLGFELPNI